MTELLEAFRPLIEAGARNIDAHTLQRIVNTWAGPAMGFFVLGCLTSIFLLCIWKAK